MIRAFPVATAEDLERNSTARYNTEGSIQDLAQWYKTEDACSFLEHLRAYQLADILGKYKLF